MAENLRSKNFASLPRALMRIGSAVRLRLWRGRIRGRRRGAFVGIPVFIAQKPPPRARPTTGSPNGSPGPNSEQFRSPKDVGMLPRQLQRAVSCIDMRRRGFILLLGGRPGGHETGQREAKTKVPPNAE